MINKIQTYSDVLHKMVYDFTTPGMESIKTIL